MERFHSRASLNVFWNETFPIPSLESAIQLLRVVTIVVVPLGGGRSARFVGNVLRVKRATKLFDETFRRYGRSRIRRSSFINALLALCNTLNRRNIAPLSHRAGQPPPRNNYTTLGRLISSREKRGRRQLLRNQSVPLLIRHHLRFFFSVVFFLSLFVSLFFFSSSLFFFQFSFSLVGILSSGLEKFFFFFSLEIFFRTRSLFSPFSFLPSSRRLICIHEKSATVSRVKIYLSVGEEGVCDGCV